MSNLRWLLPPVRGFPVSQRYGERKAVYARLGLPDGHEGIDWATPVGTPVRAAASGAVVTLNRNVNTKHPYGLYLRVQHAHAGDTWITVYAHLSRIAPGLVIGSWVECGEVIGWTGNTGRSTGPHLHFSVRRDGRIVDPEPYLQRESE